MNNKCHIVVRALLAGVGALVMPFVMLLLLWDQSVPVWMGWITIIGSGIACLMLLPIGRVERFFLALGYALLMTKAVQGFGVALSYIGQ